jgi:hypothetical protein
LPAHVHLVDLAIEVDEPGFSLENASRAGAAFAAIGKAAGRLQWSNVSCAFVMRYDDI